MAFLLRYDSRFHSKGALWSIGQPCRQMHDFQGCQYYSPPFQIMVRMSYGTRRDAAQYIVYT